MTKAALENKREVMEDLERSEAEAQRLQSALSGSATASRIGGAGAPSLLSGDHPEEGIGEITQGPTRIATEGSSYSTPMRRKTSSGGSGSGLLSAISYSIQGMMDVDPETARRNNMSKTKEAISQVGQFIPLGASTNIRT